MSKHINAATIQSLIDIIPSLDEAEAMDFLRQAEGVLEDACSLALEANKWSSAESKKKKFSQKNKKKESTFHSVESISNNNGFSDRSRNIRQQKTFKKSQETTVPKVTEPEPAKVVMVTRSSKTVARAGLSFAEMAKIRTETPTPEVVQTEQVESEPQEAPQEEGTPEEKTEEVEVLISEVVVAEETPKLPENEEALDRVEPEEVEPVFVPKTVIQHHEKKVFPVREKPFVYVPTYESCVSLALPASYVSLLLTGAVAFNGQEGTNVAPQQPPKMQQMNYENNGRSNWAIAPEQAHRYCPPQQSSIPMSQHQAYGDIPWNQRPPSNIYSTRQYGGHTQAPALQNRYHGQQHQFGLSGQSHPRQPQLQRRENDFDNYTSSTQRPNEQTIWPEHLNNKY